jgi:hypothetical protein
MSIIIHVLNSQFGGCCNAHHCFAVSCSYMTPRPTFATGWWIESEWLKKQLYGYQQCVKWCSWFVLIIIHALNSQFGSCCNAHHCFVTSCSYLTQRPTFATGEESSQSDWRSTCMITNLFLNSVAGLYWSSSMSWIHNLEVAAMPTTVLLFRVSILPRGHHLKLVRNWVKVTEEAHFWVPTYF